MDSQLIKIDAFLNHERVCSEMSRYSTWAILVVVAALFLSACASIQPATDGASPDAPTGAGSLIVYAGRSENLVGPLIEQFREQSGIDVQVRYGSTAELAAALLEEGANSPADLYYAQDPGGVGAVANAGLLAQLPDELLDQVKPEFRSPTSLWMGISGRARTVVYNTELLTPDDLPEDIWEFTDPQWNGRIGWAPTNASFQAMVTAMRVLWGEDRTREWLEGIQANNPIIFEGNAPIVQAVAAGEVEVGLVNHYYLYRFLSEEGEGFRARNYFLSSGGPGSLVMVSGVGRLAAGRNEANALTFLEFLVSPEAQQYFVEQTNEYPVIDSVAGPENLTPIEELNAADVDLTDLADLQGTTQLLSEVGVLP
jgi:iron(III) transport system substrate-binding protein